MASEPIRLGAVSDFPPGEGVRVDVDGLPVPVAVFNVDGDFYALPDACPHKGGPLSRAGTAPRGPDDLGTRGKLDPDRGTVTCPWHSLEFDLETGECPATRYRVRAFDVAVEDGVVHLAP